MVAVLVAADHVIEPVGRLHADGFQIRDDVLRAETGVACFHQNGGPIGAFDEHRAAPADVDVVNLELLCGEGQGKKNEDDDQATSHAHVVSLLGDCGAACLGAQGECCDPKCWLRVSA